MRLHHIVIAVAASASLLASAAGQTTSPIPKRIAKLLATTDGASSERAFKVRGVGEEYAVARALGVQVESQSLVVEKRAYDVLRGKDAAGNQRELWFDISAFYPMF